MGLFGESPVGRTRLGWREEEGVERPETAGEVGAVGVGRLCPWDQGAEPCLMPSPAFLVTFSQAGSVFSFRS